MRAGGTATFTAGTFGDPPTSFQWRRNGAAITNAKSASYTLQVVSLSQAGSYSVLLNSKVASAAGALAMSADAARATPRPRPAPLRGRA